MYKILFTSFLSFWLIQFTNGACQIIGDIPPVIYVKENYGNYDPVIKVVTSVYIDDIIFNNNPNNTKYFTIKTPYLNSFHLHAQISNFFTSENDANWSLFDIEIFCVDGERLMIPEIKFVIQDVNNNRPKFEPISANYALDLPYHGPPINWEQFIKVTDADFELNNTKLRFFDDGQGLIDLTNYDIERVPQDENVRLEYYKLYFGMNSTWSLAGTFNTIIYAQEEDGQVPVEFPVQLTIGKQCKILTDVSAVTKIVETWPVGFSLLTLDVQYVENIDTSLDPINDKYLTYEFDKASQKIKIRVKSLLNYFDNENIEILTISQLNLECIGVTEMIPDIKFEILDLNTRAPEFEFPSITYYPFLSTDGHDTSLEIPVRVRDKDFENEFTSLTFTLNRNDVIIMSADRVPPNSERLEYYEIKFSLKGTWTQSGLEMVILTAKNDDLTANLTVVLDIKKCQFTTNMMESFIISEEAEAGQVALTLDVEGVTGIDTIDDPYFTLELDTLAQKIYLMPTQNLSTYFDENETAEFRINNLNLICGQTVHVEPQISLLIQDENNKIPQFDDLGASYDVTIPYFGAPINWEKFIRVTDQDFFENNTAIIFTTDRDDLIVFTPEIPERVPLDPGSRLEYYKVYFGMNKTWAGTGEEIVQIRATDGAGNFDEFEIVLNIVHE